MTVVSISVMRQADREGRRTKSEQEGQRAAVIAGVVDGRGKGVLGRVHLVPGSEGEEQDDDEERGSDVDEDEKLGKEGQVTSLERVERAVEDEQTGVETELLACGDDERGLADNDGAEDHLGQTPLGRGDTSDLAEKVEPSNDPSGHGTVFLLFVENHRSQ